MGCGAETKVALEDVKNLSGCIQGALKCGAGRDWEDKMVREREWKRKGNF